VEGSVAALALKPMALSSNPEGMGKAEGIAHPIAGVFRVGADHTQNSPT
jgi:hypothetical protein